MATQNLAYLITVNDAELRLAQSHIASFNAELAASTVTGRKLDTQMRSVGRRAAQTGAFFTRNFTLPLALAGAESVKLASTFDAQIGKIAGLTNQSAAGVNKLSEAARNLAGKRNTAGPTQLAEGMYFLASAGLKTNQVLKSIGPVATGAAVGLGSVADVARLVAQSMNTYGASTLSAAHAVDVLTKTVALGLLPPEELAGALGRVLPLAKAAGASFSDVNANIAILTREGLSANLAVTGLRSELGTFAKAQPGVQKALYATGTSIQAVQKSIRTIGLFPTLLALRRRFEADFGATTSNVFTKQTLNSIKQGKVQFEQAVDEVRAKLTGGKDTALIQEAKLFPNIRALTAFLITTGAQAKNNAHIAAQLALTDKQVGVALKRAFEQRVARDPSFRLRQQLAQLQVVGVELGNKLLPPLVRVGEGVLGLVHGFEHLNPIFKGFLTHLALTALVAGPIVSLFGRLTQGASGVAALYGFIGKKATEAAYKQRNIPLEADRALIELRKTTVQMGEAINAGVTVPAAQAQKALVELGVAARTAAPGAVAAFGPKGGVIPQPRGRRATSTKAPSGVVVAASPLPIKEPFAAGSVTSTVQLQNNDKLIASIKRVTAAETALSAAQASNLGTRIEAKRIKGLQAEVVAANEAAVAAKLNADAVFGADKAVVAAHQQVTLAEERLAAARVQGTETIGPALAANSSIIAANEREALSALALARAELELAQQRRAASISTVRGAPPIPTQFGPAIAPAVVTGLEDVRIKATGAAKAMLGLKFALKSVAGFAAFQFGIQALTDLTGKTHVASRTFGDLAATVAAGSAAFGQWEVAIPAALVALTVKTHILDGAFRHLFGGVSSGAASAKEAADGLTKAIDKLHPDRIRLRDQANITAGVVIDPAALAKVKELERTGDKVAAKALLQAAQEQAISRQSITAAQLLISVEGAKSNAAMLNSVAGVTQSAAAKIKSAFSTAFSNLNNEILSRFDEGVTKTLDVFDAQTQTILDNFDTKTQKLSDNLKTLVKVPRLDETFTIKTNGKTPAEIELAALDKVQEKRDFIRQEEDARKNLANAFLIGDPNAIRDAQKQLEDADLAKKRFGLEARAATERAAADRQQKAAQERQADQRKRERQGLANTRDAGREHLVAVEDLRRKNLEAEIKAEEKKFQEGRVNARKFTADLLKILGKRAEFQKIGNQVGGAYGAGVTAALKGLQKLLNAHPIIPRIGKDGAAKTGAELGKAFADAFVAAQPKSFKDFQEFLKKGGTPANPLPGTGAPTLGGVKVKTGIPSLDTPERPTKLTARQVSTPTRRDLQKASLLAGVPPGEIEDHLPKAGRPSVQAIETYFKWVGPGGTAIMKKIFTREGLTRFATGAVVPGTGNRDTVPALLTPGEIVFNRPQQRKLGKLLGRPGAGPEELFAAVHNPRRFASGGVVASTQLLPLVRREDSLLTLVQHQVATLLGRSSPRATQVTSGVEIAENREIMSKNLKVTETLVRLNLQSALTGESQMFTDSKRGLGVYQRDVETTLGQFRLKLRNEGAETGKAYSSAMLPFFTKLVADITADMRAIRAQANKTSADLKTQAASLTSFGALRGAGPAGKGRFSDKRISRLLQGVGFTGAQAKNFVGIAHAESGGRVDALNDNPSTGDYSVGLFQENFFGALGPARTRRYAPLFGLPPNMDPKKFVAWLRKHPRAQAIIARDLFNSSGYQPWMGDAYVKSHPGLIQRASGGTVPGHGNQDTVPAMLTPGEVVFNRRHQRTLGRMLGKPGARPEELFQHVDRFGSGGVEKKLPGYARGGVVRGTKASPREDLWDAIQRMEKEGYSDQDIAGQVHRWHKSVDVDKLATALHWKRRKKNIWERAASDVATIVKGTPKGLYQLGKLLAAPTFDDIVYGPSSKQAARARSAQEQFAKAAALQPLHDLRHPLRHPVYTFLDIAPGLTKLLQLGAAGRVVRLGDAAKVNLKYSRAGRFAAKFNASQRGFRARDRLIDALGANDVGWKMGLEKGDVFSTAIDRPGQPPLIVDHRKTPYGLEEVPGTERPPKFLYRAISDEEYRVAKKQGFFKSDGRMNLVSTEGTVAALSDPSYYLPGKLASSVVGRHKGRIIRIRYAENDGWIFDTDGYVKTQQSIPFGRVDRAPRVDTIKKDNRHTVNRVPIGGRLKTRGQNLLGKVIHDQSGALTLGRPARAGISVLAEQARMDVLKEVRGAEWNRGGRELAESTLANLVTGKTYLARGRGGKLTGVAHLADLRGDKSELVSLATTAGSQGVGRALVERVARDARGEGAKRLNLLSSLSAEPFYEHLGFKRLFEKGGRFEAELPLVDKAKGLSPHELRRHQIHATVRQILHDQTGSLTIGRKFNVQEARTELAQLETKYEGFIDHFLGSGKLTPDEMAEQRAINTVRGRYRRQQSGRDRLGRPSGASGSKVQFLPKNVREQQRLQVEEEVRKIAERHPELPAARNFLRASGRIDELQQAISSFEERSFLSKLIHDERGSVTIPGRSIEELIGQAGHGTKPFVVRSSERHLLPKDDGLYYHGTSLRNAYRIVRSRILKATEADRAVGSGPKGAWLTKDPDAAGFWGKFIVATPERLVGDQVKRHPLGIFSSPTDVVLGKTAKAAARTRAFARDEVQIFGEFEPKEELYPRDYARYKALTRRGQGVAAQRMLSKVRPKIDDIAKKLGLDVDIRSQHGPWRGEKNFGYALHVKIPSGGFTPAFEDKVKTLTAITGKETKQGSLSFGRVVSHQEVGKNIFPGLFWNVPKGEDAGRAQLAMDKLVGEGNVGFIPSPERNGFYVVNFEAKQKAFNEATKKLGIKGKQVNWQGSYLYDRRLHGMGETEVPGVSTFQEMIAKSGLAKSGVAAVRTPRAKPQRFGELLAKLPPFDSGGATAEFEATALAHKGQPGWAPIAASKLRGGSVESAIKGINETTIEFHQYRRWYEAAAITARETAKRLGVQSKQFVRVLGLLSLGKNPTSNFRDAAQVVRAIKATGEPLTKASFEAAGSHEFGSLARNRNQLPLIEQILGVRKGVVRGRLPKLNPFLQGILRFTNPKEFAREGALDPVALDRHATSFVAPGQFRINKKGQKEFDPGNSNEYLAELYRVAAKRMGLTGQQAQASTWVYEKALKRAARHGHTDFGRYIVSSSDAYFKGFRDEFGDEAADKLEQRIRRQLKYGVKGFARGGWLPGRGWKDTVPAMLTPGEIVLNKGQQANLGQMVGKEGASPQALFEHIARAGRYASGGVVQAFAPGGVVSDVVSEHGFRGQVQLPLPIIKGFTDATKSLTKLLTVIARGAARQENLKQDPRTAELILGGVRAPSFKADSDKKLARLAKELKAGGVKNAAGAFLTDDNDRLKAIRKEIKAGGTLTGPETFTPSTPARLKKLRHDLDPVNITKLVNDDPRLSKLSEARKQALEGTLARLQAHPVRGGLITVGKDGKVVTGSAAGNTLGVPFAGHGIPLPRKGLAKDDGSGFLSDAAKRARDRSQQHSVPRNDTLAVPTGGGAVSMTFGAVTVIVQGAENPEKTALAVRRNLQGIAGRNAPRRRGGGAGTRVVGA